MIRMTSCKRSAIDFRPHVVEAREEVDDTADGAVTVQTVLVVWAVVAVEVEKRCNRRRLLLLVLLLSLIGMDELVFGSDALRSVLEADVVQETDVVGVTFVWVQE